MKTFIILNVGIKIPEAKRTYLNACIQFVCHLGKYKINYFPDTIFKNSKRIRNLNVKHELIQAGESMHEFFNILYVKESFTSRTQNLMQ